MDERSKHLRRLVIKALQGADRGHVAPSLSLIEILRVLYDSFLNVKASDPTWPLRDRCILSKGHGCLALYAVLADKGFFSQEELNKFCAKGAMLGGYPEAHKVPGVEASTGALAHGLSIGVGMALAAKLQKRPSKVVVVTGGDEINEGSIWEAAVSAAKHQLDNLIVVVDYSKLQSCGPIKHIMDLEPIGLKWQSFGFNVQEVDGHDVEALQNSFEAIPLQNNKPSTVICHTVKGKGFAFAELDPAWHHKSYFSAEQIAQMYDALETYP
ncbi:MAG: transketolase [Gammaproteobacteria bacterium SG8_11]|nr:MAG: transketolase [Gammaproteobacteria bacterium SG8_11]